MSEFDMRDDETYSEYKSRKLREKGPGFNVAMGQKRYNPDDPKKSEAAQRAIYFGFFFDSISNLK